MTLLEQIPQTVRARLEASLIVILELDEGLKRYWWSSRSRHEMLCNQAESLRQAKNHLRFFKQKAAERHLNGTAVLRLLYRELRGKRPQVNVLSGEQVARLYTF
ncbi:MAG: hypothetical protein K1Y36_28235 [Blastocatellia bacterium]|nr:hypothetical protein [Blastocatellia bacterium]